MPTCTHIQKQASTQTHTKKHTHTQTQKQAYMHAHTCTNTYVYTQKACTHIHNTFTGKQAYINVHRPHNKVIPLNTIAVVWTRMSPQAHVSEYFICRWWCCTETLQNLWEAGSGWRNQRAGRTTSMLRCGSTSRPSLLLTEAEA